MTYIALADHLPETVGHSEHYFAERHCHIDARGPLTIDASSKWGFFVTVITLSHVNGAGTDAPEWATTCDRPVIVEAGAWIGSNSTLYNCRIGIHAVVAVGTVVRSQDVAPYTMVAGNPARIIARFVDGKWQYTEARQKVIA